MKFQITLILSLFLGKLVGAETSEDGRLLRRNREHLIITATGTERQSSTLPANVSVITQEDIQKSTAQTLPDVFKYLAGVDVREEYGDFSNTAVDIRGFGEVAAANSQILVDGRRLNRSDMAAVNFSTVPLERIERIEIYRGGRSVLYGNGATGGVINIITKKDRPDGHTLRLSTEFGTQESYRYSALLDGKVGETIYSVDGTYFDTNGWRVNNFERIKSSGFTIYSREFENWDLFMSGNVSQTKVGSPGTRPAGGSRKDASSKTNYFEIEEKSVTFSPRYWFNDNVNLEIGNTYREGESAYTAGTVTSHKDYVLSPKLTIDHKLGGIKNTTIAGVDYGHDKQILTNERNRRWYGFYLFNTSSFLDDSLFVDMGYRRERYKMHIQNSTQNFSPEDLDAATLGVTYKYAEGSKVFISLDKSFRYQRIDELGGDSFDTFLPPQTTYTYQGGFAHQLSKEWQFSATYFHIDTQNEIFYEPSAGSFGQNISYEYTERDGYELELNYKPLDNLSIFANFTHIRTELGGDGSTADADKGNRIPAVPRESIGAGFSWDFVKHFNLSMSSKWVDRFYVRGDYANTSDKDDGYIVTDAKLTYTWNWLSIYAGCNNLFGEAYNSNSATFGSYPAPGRTFFGGVSVTFEF